MRSHWLDSWENEQDDNDEDFNERAAIIQFDVGMTKLRVKKTYHGKMSDIGHNSLPTFIPDKS